MKPRCSGSEIKCAVLWHSRSWVRALAQATAPPMLVDMSDGCKYVEQKGLAAMPYTRLYSVLSIII